MTVESVKRFIQLLEDSSFWESKKGEHLVYQVKEIMGGSLAEQEKVYQICLQLSHEFRLFDFDEDEIKHKSQRLLPLYFQKNYERHRLSETERVLILALDLLLANMLKADKETLIHGKDEQQKKYVQQRCERRKKDLFLKVEVVRLPDNIKLVIKDITHLNFLELEILNHSNLSVLNEILRIQQEVLSGNTSFKLRDIAFESWLPKSNEELVKQEDMVSNWLNNDILLSNEIYLVLDSLHFFAQNFRLFSFLINSQSLLNRDVRHAEFDKIKTHLTAEIGRRGSKLYKLSYLQEWLDVASFYCKTSKEIVIEGRKSLPFEILTHIENLKQVILDAKIEENQHVFNDERLTTLEAYEYLGIKRAAFYRWKKKHDIKSVSVGNQNLYFKSELDRYKIKKV